MKEIQNAFLAYMCPINEQATKVHTLPIYADGFIYDALQAKGFAMELEEILLTCCKPLGNGEYCKSPD